MELKSPLDGVINYMSNYSQGWMNAQPFKVGDHAVSGGVLAEIPDLATLQMESKVDEVDRGRHTWAIKFWFTSTRFPEKVMPATLVSITPLCRRRNNEWPPTRSFRAYAQIDVPDARLRLGMNSGADIVENEDSERCQHSREGAFHASRAAGRLPEEGGLVCGTEGTGEGEKSPMR